MDPGQLPTFDPCCEFGLSTQLSETIYLGLEGARVAPRGGGWESLSFPGTRGSRTPAACGRGERTPRPKIGRAHV